jgi:RHS repeat-associated protein
VVAARIVLPTAHLGLLGTPAIRTSVLGFLLILVLGFVPQNARAQACTTLDPPCPPPREPSVNISPAGGTVYATDLTVEVSLFGEAGLDAATYQATWTGVTILSTSGPFWQSSSGTASWVVRLQSGVTATLTVQVCDQGYQGAAPQCSADNQSWNYSASPPPVQYATPFVSTAYHNGLLRDVSLCVEACFDGVLRYSTPAYVSLDGNRSVTLVYSRAQAVPRGLVQVDALDNSSNPPNTMSLRLQRPDQSWVTFTNNTTELFFASGFGVSRLAAQFDASGLATGAYDYSAVVRSRWADGTIREAAPLPLRVLITRENASPYGYGWWIAGLTRITEQSNGLVVTTGDGSIAFFANCATGCNTYQSPLGDFTTVIRRTDGTGYDRSWPDGSVARFDINGRLTSVVDRYGYGTSYGYNGTTFQLASLTDPAGVLTTLGYDAAGKLDWIQTPGARVTQVTINSAGDLTQIDDPDGQRSLSITYDGNHIPVTQVDRLGGAWDLAYDFAGKLASITFPTVTADGASVRPVRTLRSFERELLVDPASGLGASSSTPAPKRLLTPARITEPRGDSTLYQFDRFGSPLTMDYWTPEGLRRTTRWEYNAPGQVRLSTDPDGKSMRYGWSGPDMVTFEDLSTGFFATLSYEPPYHQLKKVTGLSGVVLEERFYSPSGRLDSTKVGNSKTRYTWDARGRLLTLVDPQSHQTTVSYYPSGMQNQQSVTAPVGNGAIRTTSIQYDSFGRSAILTDAAGRTHRRAYDLLNRIVQTVGPANDTTRFVHNDVTRVYTTTDAIGQSYSSAVNALGWEESRTDPRNAIERWTYDRNGNIRTYTNRRGGVVTNTYDELNRVRTIAADGKTTTWTYASTAAGDIVVVANDESTDTLIYASPTGLLSQASTVLGGVNHRLTYTHTAEREPRAVTMERMTSPSWSRGFEFGYDAFRRFNWLRDMNGQGSGITYNSDQLPDTLKLPITTSGSAKLRETYSYTPGHVVSRIGLTWFAHDYALGRRYSYDDLNRATIIRRGQAPGNPNAQEFQDEYRRTLTYDVAGRLTQYQDHHDWEEDGGIICPDPFDLNSCYQEVIPHSTLIRQESYSYDRVGNRTDHAALVQSGNRVTSFDGYTLQYDADGNLTSKTKSGVWQQTFTWNTIGQLVAVSTNGASTTFGYDGEGRRVRKTHNGVTTRYLWDDEDLIAELDGAGNPIREYAYFPGIDSPHSMRRSSDGAMFYYTTELPGHVTGLVSWGNQAVNRYEHDPWGVTLSVTEGTSQPLRYGGREYDAEIGLYYNRARYYDPQVGRFISEDPIGLAGGINLYAYVSNDPIQNVDPSGLDPNCPSGYTLVIEIDLATNTLVTYCESTGGGGHRVVPNPVSLDPVTVTACQYCGPYDFQPGRAGRGPSGFDFNGPGIGLAGGTWLPIGRDGIEFRNDVDPFKGPHTHFRQHGREFREILNRHNRLQPHVKNAPSITNKVIRALRAFGFTILRMPLIICIGCQNFNPSGLPPAD